MRVFYMKKGEYVMDNTGTKIPFSDNIYRLAIYMALLAVVSLIKPTLYPLSICRSSMLLLIALLILYVEITVFIKHYEFDTSATSDLLRSVAVPVLAYLLLCFSRSVSFTGAIKGGSVSIAFFCSAFLLILLHDWFRRRDKRFFIKALAMGLSTLRSSMIMCMSVFLIYLVITNPGTLGSNNNAAEYKDWSNDCTICANYDTLKVLADDSTFAAITSTDIRLSLFKDVVDVETNYLGIPYDLKVCLRQLEFGINAQYGDAEKTIYVDEDYLSSCTSEELITTASHEVRHAYQHQMASLYSNVRYSDKEAAAFLRNNSADRFLAEFSDYEDGTVDYESYSSQYCECDAREYARLSCEKWQSVLSDLTLLESAGGSWDTTNTRRSLYWK